MQRLQAAVKFASKHRDNLWGDDTEKRVGAVRAASRYHGVKFPHGVKLAQRSVGTKVDGSWGANSRAAHDKAVVKIQTVLGVARDGIWGPATDRAFLALRKDKKL